MSAKPGREYADEPLPLEGADARPVPRQLPGPSRYRPEVCEHCGLPVAWHTITARGNRIEVRCSSGVQTRSFDNTTVHAAAGIVGIDTERARY